MQRIVSIESCRFFFKTKYNFTEKLLMNSHISISMRILGNTGMELHDAEEAVRMRKILAGDIRKESTNQGGQLLDFYRYSESYAGPKSNLHSHTEISSMASLTPKSSMWCYFFEYFLLTNF